MPSHPHFVVVGRLAHHDTQQTVGLHVPYGATSVVCAADDPWPDELRARVIPNRGAKPLRGSKRLAKLDLLHPGSGHHWVVRRRAAEAIAALGRPGDIRLVPAPLVDDDGVLDPDWALVDIRAIFPLDRDAADFAATDATAPHASLIAEVRRVDWSPDRRPTAPLFRVAEAPELLCVRQDLLGQLQAILGPWVVAQPTPYDAARCDGVPCAPLRGAGGLHRQPVGQPAPPVPIDEETGKSAVEAFYRLFRGSADPADRRAACASPLTAYFVARIVDAAPRDDTRAGALLHPRYATLYARDVDGGPRDDTRAVALRERASAYDYLAFVERTPSPAFVAALGEETVASQLAEIPSLRAGLTPPPPRFPAPWAVG